MKRREWIFFGLCAAAYVAARGPAALVGPFILPFENAFQEAIALHHLGHFFNNRFLPVLARIDGVNFYHTAHPPLLHLFYAALYSIFGTAEWVTRAAALALYLASVLLWRRTGADADEPGWPLYPLALFLPVPFILATTTNYEPLSIFFVSLIFYFSEPRLQSRDKLLWARLQSRWPLLLALVFGMLVDWPVYLAVPALLIRHWREKPRRNFFLALIAFEAVFLAALLGYMYLVAGEVALFGHAPQRANPAGLLSLDLWRELGSHWLELSGVAATIVAASAVLAVLRRSFSGHAGTKVPATAFELFALFAVILVLAAPQLVSRHHVYLLYFAPPVALALKDLVLRVGSKKLAVLALLLLFASHNYIVRYQRNPAYWAMAERVKDKGITTAFASAAIGAWYYYAGIETVFPMSAAAAKWFETSSPGLVDIDSESSEVKGYENFGSDMQDQWVIPGERVMIKKGGMPQYFEPKDLLLDASYFFLMKVNPDGSTKEYREQEWGYFQPPRTNFISRRGRIFYGFQQLMVKAPRTNSQIITGPGFLNLQPAIVHSLPGAKSDGAQFLAWARSGLKYSRFVPDGIAPKKQRVTGWNINCVVLPGPKNNQAFDDAWWLEPVWEPAPGTTVEPKGK